MTPRGFIICGFKKSGKTTLTERLVRAFCARGTAVGVLKRSAHPLAHNPAPTDTERQHRAGACRVVGLFPDGRLTLTAIPGREPENWREEFSDCELVLLEGFKDYPLPRIFLCGNAGRIPPDPADPWLRAAGGFDRLAPDWLRPRRLPWFVIDQDRDTEDLLRLIEEEAQ